MKLSKRLSPLASVGVGLAVVAMAAGQFAHPAMAARPAGDKSMHGKVGFLFSDFTTSARWEFDKAYFIHDLHQLDPNVQIITTDAKAVQTTQQTQAQSLLTRGVKVLLDVPVDSAQAAAIVRDAHAQKPRVPVIAYDRLITGATEDAYASFDGYSVGVQQGQYIVAHVKKGGMIVSIAGSPTDNNAHLFYKGAMSVLRPLFKKGYYKLGYDKFTPNWDPATAQQEMASALNKLGNKVNGVLVANDGMAGGVVQALKAQHLAGKVVVTGQDATVAGLQQILLGNQSMTVYKPLRLLAQAAATITDDFLHHRAFHSKVYTVTGAGSTPSALEKVITVTKANIKTTVIADHFVTKKDLCTGIPASACKGL